MNDAYVFDLPRACLDECPWGIEKIEDEVIIGPMFSVEFWDWLAEICGMGRGTNAEDCPIWVESRAEQSQNNINLRLSARITFFELDHAVEFKFRWC